MLHHDPAQKRITQQRKELATVPVQRGPNLGNDLIDRELLGSGPRGHPRDLPIQTNFLIR
jgi:hypothetical protein